jgi:hypothetical protein
LFLSRDSNNCEEFRSGQEKQSDGFESAAYANFATPAALNFASLPKPAAKPIGRVNALDSVTLMSFGREGSGMRELAR